MRRIRIAIIPVLIVASIAAMNTTLWWGMPDQDTYMLGEAKTVVTCVEGPTGSQRAYFRAREQGADAFAETTSQAQALTSGVQAPTGSQEAYFRARERGAFCR